MKFRLAALGAATVLAAGNVVAQEQAEAHRMVLPDQLQWQAVPSLPAGAQVAVIEGPINEAVPFTFRLKFPPGYRIPPHWHPAVERITVLSGTFHMGLGDSFDQSSGMALPSGGVMIIQPKNTHFAWTEEDVVIQLNGNGPWAINYVNPDDDPRKATQ